MGPLIHLINFFFFFFFFLTSGDVCPWVSKPGWLVTLHIMDSSESLLVRHRLISWWAVWQPSIIDSCTCRSCVHKHWRGFEQQYAIDISQGNVSCSTGVNQPLEMCFELLEICALKTSWTSSTCRVICFVFWVVSLSPFPRLKH